jgi:cytochrome c6
MKKIILRACAALALVTIIATPVLLAEGADGKALYDKKCAMCHGKDGVAKKMAEGSGNFNDAAWQEGIAVDAIIENITKGKGKMKGLEGKLTEDEIKAVAEYVKSM